MKRTWDFYIKAQEVDVTSTVKVTGGPGERTITVNLINLTDQAKNEPLTVEVLEAGEIVETLEDHASVGISPLGKTTKTYNYTPSGNGWLIRVAYGED